MLVASRGMPDVSPLTTDQTCALAVEERNPNRWTAKVPHYLLKYYLSTILSIIFFGNLILSSMLFNF